MGRFSDRQFGDRSFDDGTFRPWDVSEMGRFAIWESSKKKNILYGVAKFWRQKQAYHSLVLLIKVCVCVCGCVCVSVLEWLYVCVCVSVDVSKCVCVCVCVSCMYVCDVYGNFCSKITQKRFHFSLNISLSYPVVMMIFVTISISMATMFYVSMKI